MGIRRMSSSRPASRAACQASSMVKIGREADDVVEDVARHELGMLEDDADLAPDLARVERGQLAAVVGDRARVGGLEAEQEPHQRRLSRARRADDRHELARADLKADVVENLRPFLLAGIAERHVVQGECARQPNRLDHGRGELGLLLEDRPDPLIPGQELEQADRGVADRPGRPP